MDILDNIIKIMKEKNISQVALCKELNLPQSQFSNWKKGQNNSYLKMLLPISKILKVDITALYGIEDFLPNTPIIDFELSQKEKDLLILFHNLNEEQQEQVKSFINNLTLGD